MDARNMAPKGKLIAKDGPLAGTEFEMARLGSYTIGRSDHNFVTIKDAAISREHCRVDYDGEFYWMIDKSSHNGTVVNGRRVTKCMLFNGDVIKVGHVHFTFSLPSELEE